MKTVPEEVRLENAGCPMGCSEDDAFVLAGSDRLHGLPGEFRVVRCLGCGLMRTNPRPDAATIGYYYPDDYGPYAYDATAESARSPEQQQPLKRPLRRLLLANLNGRDIPADPPGRLLEFGCASGSYLDIARAAGWQSEGIEFSSAAAESARSRGHTVYTGVVESTPAPESPYDVIVGWMVLEHLHDPVGVLRQLKKWSHEDTMLGVCVPDMGALEFRLFGSRLYSLHLPAHLNHFTRKSLVRLLDAAGWSVERTIWHANPNNLLHSLKYVAEDRGWRRLKHFCEDMASGKRAGRTRLALGLLLRALRQSGRITVWARPKSSSRLVQRG